MTKDKQLLERVILQLPPGRARSRYERMLVQAENAECHPEPEVSVSPALLEAEEALFRLWWRTLPDKTKAKQQWEEEVAWYGAQKGLSTPFLDALKTRLADLRKEPET